MKRNVESGMSLVESTIVVLMLCVLAATAVPNVMSARNSHRLRIVADAIVQQLYICRGRALATNQTCAIKIDEAIGFVQIDTNLNGLFSDKGGGGLPSDDPGTAIDLSGIELVSGDSPIVRKFTARGEVPWQENAEGQSITVIYGGLKRVITIEQRGSILLGEETSAY